MNPFDKLGMDFGDVMAPWIAILVSIAVAFWFKDFVTNLMQGLKFKMNPAFNEGDAVIEDALDAIIVKIEKALERGTNIIILRLYLALYFK